MRQTDRQADIYRERDRGRERERNRRMDRQKRTDGQKKTGIDGTTLRQVVEQTDRQTD